MLSLRLAPLVTASILRVQTWLGRKTLSFVLHTKNNELIPQTQSRQDTSTSVDAPHLMITKFVVDVRRTI